MKSSFIILARYGQRYQIIQVYDVEAHIVDLAAKRNSPLYYSYSEAEKVFLHLIACLEHKQEIISRYDIS